MLSNNLSILVWRVNREYSLVPDTLAQLKRTDNRNHRHNLRRKRFAVFVLPGLGFVDAEAFPTVILVQTQYPCIAATGRSPHRLGPSGADNVVITPQQIMPSCANAN